MKKLILSGLCCLILVNVGNVGHVARADEIPYKEGSVWSVVFIRTEANLTKEYLKELSYYWQTLMDKAKEERLILSYKVLLGSAANRKDFDLMLMIEFKNMASLDNTSKKWEALEKKLFTKKKTDAIIQKYAKVRELIGEKLMREIHLK
jgi:hypothetical protein